MAVALTMRPYEAITYEQMTAPLREYAKAYKETQEEWDELSQNTSAWGPYIDQNLDTGAYTTYNSYNTELGSAVDDFSKGMTLQNKRQLRNLKRRYDTDMTKLGIAIKRRRELADEQRKLLSNDPTYRFENDANNISLDDFIANPNTTTGGSFSGQDVYKYTASVASNLANAVLSDPTKYRSVLGGYYWEIAQDRGATPSDILAAINNEANNGNSEAQQALSTIKESVATNFIGNWQGSNIVRQDGSTTINPFSKGYKAIEGFINDGLWSAIGDSKIQYLQDPETHAMLERNERLWEWLNKPEIQGRSSSSSGGSGESKQRGTQSTSFINDIDSEGETTLETQGWQPVISSTIIQDASAQPVDYSDSGEDYVINTDNFRNLFSKIDNDRDYYELKNINKNNKIMLGRTLVEKDDLNWMIGDDGNFISYEDLSMGNTNNSSEDDTFNGNIKKKKATILYNALHPTAHTNVINKNQFEQLTQDIAGGIYSMVKVKGRRQKHWWQAGTNSEDYWLVITNPGSYDYANLNYLGM